MRRPHLCSTLPLVLSTLILCSEACSPQGPDPNPGWTHYSDPAGFSIELPEGWSVLTDPGTGRIQVTGTNQVRAVIWPVWAARDLGPAEAAQVLGLLARRWEPQQAWSNPLVLQPGLVGVQSQDGSRAFLAWNSTPRGSSGSAFLLPATSSPGIEENEVLAQILGSFRLRGGDPGQSEERAQHRPGQRWTDPNEGAFSVEVPSGWQVTGGTFRPSSILTQAKVELSSPDGLVYAYFGDTFPWFVEPNQFLGPGQIYRDPMGGSSPVWPYLPGNLFLTQYLLPQRWGQGRVEVRTDQPRPEIAGQLGHLALGMNRFDAGEVRYAFQRENIAYEGAAICVTQAFQSGGFSTWQVYRLALAEAPRGRLAEGEAAVGQLAAGFRIDPVWAQGEAAKAGVNSRVITEMSEAVSSSVSSAFRYRQDSQDRVREMDADARRGIERLVDPLTGQGYEVSSGSRYYWVDPRGTVVGTDTDSLPQIDFRQLLGADR